MGDPNPLNLKRNKPQYVNVHQTPQSYGYAGYIPGLVSNGTFALNIFGYNYSEAPKLFLKDNVTEITPLQSFHNAKGMVYTYVFAGSIEDIYLLTTEDIYPATMDARTGVNLNTVKVDDVCLDQSRTYTRWVIEV
jgi:hypothetical protein